MAFPITRLRRLRRTSYLRDLVRENRVEPARLIAPLFVVPGSGVRREISSLPDNYHLSVDCAGEEAAALFDLGIPACLLFGIPETKDETGSSAYKSDGVIQRAIEAIKAAAPEMLVITDLCFCEYTSHGHCGIIKDGALDNDSTLQQIVLQTISHARAGADLIAPSGMIDGAVGSMRHALDENGFLETGIMSYSAKYCSAFYGPFREAVQSAPSFGDRKTYQMDPANGNEALREVELDLQEGADIVMVKPAMPYLDIIRAVKERFKVPTAAYQVSGEYAMIRAAAEKGWLNPSAAMLESLLCIRRAGADMIITYFARRFAEDYKSLR